MNCATAPDPESPSVECCEIIFPCSSLLMGVNRSLTARAMCFHPLLIRAPTKIAFNEGRERCGRNKLALKRAGV